MAKVVYYISARNAWDTMPIGYFNTYAEALKALQVGWSEKLIKSKTL